MDVLFGIVFGLVCVWGVIGYINAITYYDKTQFETSEYLPLLYDSLALRGWARQKYIIKNGVAGYKSEFE